MWIVFQYPIRHRTRVANLWLNYQFSRKNVGILCRWQFCVIFRAVNTMFMFPNINEGINCKIFLLLPCLPPNPLEIHCMNQIKLSSQGLALLGFLPTCNIIFQIIDQCRYFPTPAGRPWFSNVLWVWGTQVSISGPKREYESLNF